MELVTGKVLFRASKEAEACDLMFSLVGTPTEETMPGCTQQQYYKQLVMKKNQERVLVSHLKSEISKGHILKDVPEGVDPVTFLGQEWFDLVDNMLHLDP